MAILHSFEVTVLVDDEECPEYVDNEIDDTASLKSTYIEARPGAHFKIQLEIMPGFDFGKANYLKWEICLDGNSIIKPLCFDHAYQREGYWRDTRGSVREKRGDEWVERKFYFTNTQICETLGNHTAEETRALSKVLGTIRVVIRRRFGGQKLGLQKEPTQMHGVVPEKAVNGQAITLSSTLGEAQQAHGHVYCEGEDVDAEPVAEFLFKYRSKDALKRLMVISRPPTPEPLVERPIDELSLDEVRELARRQKEELEVVRMKIKREDQVLSVEDDRESTISGDEVVATASRPVRSRSGPGPESVVIDLSD